MRRPWPGRVAPLRQADTWQHGIRGATRQSASLCSQALKEVSEGPSGAPLRPPGPLLQPLLEPAADVAPAPADMAGGKALLYEYIMFDMDGTLTVSNINSRSDTGAHGDPRRRPFHRHGLIVTTPSRVTSA